MFGIIGLKGCVAAVVKVDSVSSIYIYKTNKMAWKNPGTTGLYCLAYQVSGNYEHKFPSDVLTVKEDTLFLIAQYTPYSVKCVEQGEAICVTFTAETELQSSVFDCKAYPEIKNLFQKLLNYKNLYLDSNRCEATAIIYRLFSFIYQRNLPGYVSSANRGKLQLAVNYLTEHYTQNGLKIGEVADKFGLHVKHFRNLFHALYNTTPSQYLISLRLQMASKLLAETELTVGEISEMSGFCDVYYFSKLFKLRFGCSPLEYRKRLGSIVAIQ